LCKSLCFRQCGLLGSLSVVAGGAIGALRWARCDQSGAIEGVTCAVLSMRCDGWGAMGLIPSCVLEGRTLSIHKHMQTYIKPCKTHRRPKRTCGYCDALSLANGEKEICVRARVREVGGCSVKG
jgi:hypothetical protein